MPDLDKVISAWEHCISDEGDCDDCPYNNDFNGCMLILKKDSIELIKELNAELTKVRAYNGILIAVMKNKTDIVRCKDCRHCFIDGDNVTYNVCELNHNKVQPDEWWCADGEVKTE